MAEGVERDPDLVARCIQRGLVVHQGNIAEGLDQYGDQTFDYVLLLGTFQELISPVEIVREAFRVGRRVIIAYSNFAHYGVRLQILFRGRTPVTKSLPQLWYRTANLHFLSILDFREFCRQIGVSEIRQACFNARGKVVILPNLFADGSRHLVGFWRTAAPGRLRLRGRCPLTLRQSISKRSDWMKCGMSWPNRALAP